MISLAMDTAGTTCAACLYDSGNGRILAETSEEIGRGHAERLMGIISEVLESAKVSYKDIGKIITTIGPGSFTGIRVSVATARGFGLGLGIPVVGVTNLEALIEEAKCELESDSNVLLVAILQAGRGEYYCQFSKDSSAAKANTPFLANLEKVAALLEAETAIMACGSAANEIAEILGSRVRVLDNQPAPAIKTIAAIGSEREEGEMSAEPLYLRKPDAKPQSGFAVERL